MDHLPNFFMLKEDWTGVKVTLRDHEFLHWLPGVECARCGHRLSSTAKVPYVKEEDRAKVFGEVEAVSSRSEFNAKVVQLPLPDAYRAEPVPPSPGVSIDRIHVYCSGVLPDIVEIYGSIIVSPGAREILHAFGAVDDHFTELVVEKGPEMPGHALFTPPMTVIGKADWRPYTKCTECGRRGTIEGQLKAIAKYKAEPDRYGPPEPLPPNPGIIGWRTTPFTPELWESVGSPHFFRLFEHGNFAAYSEDLIDALWKLKAIAVRPEPIKLIGYERAGESE